MPTGGIKIRKFSKSKSGKSLRGDASLSESMINIFTLVLSFILIIMIVKGLFIDSADRTYASSFEPVARDVAATIDRIGALAGSQMVGLEIPKGMDINLSIDHKLVTVYHDKGRAQQAYSGLINSGPYFFENPRELCFVKNREDLRITIVPKKCACRLGDGVCDPECLLEYICDPDCLTEDEDFVCSRYCSKSGDGICDPDCYRNERSNVCDFDCIQPSVSDGICDPDCDGIVKGVCDLDCKIMYNGTSGADGVCDPDCLPIDNNGDGFEDFPDGFCYTGCAEKSGIFEIRVQENPEYSCDPSTDCAGGWGETNTNWRCGGDRRLICCGEPLERDGGAFVCLDGLNGWTGVNYCYQNDFSLGADCAQHKNKHVSQDEADEYIKGQKEWMVCCCDQGGSCEHTNYYTCGSSNRQSYPKEHSYCNKIGQKQSIVKLPKDGICDLDCYMDENICDPDCHDDIGCEFRCAMPEESCASLPCCYNDVTKGVCCPGTLTCADASDPSKPACCGNEICEVSPVVAKLFGSNSFWDIYANPRHWENEYTCPEDCEAASDIVREEYCETGEAGDFDKSPAYYDTGGDRDNKVYWTEGAIEICSEAAIEFLDQRGWDIKQVEASLLMPPPIGFAFDASRYQTIRNRQGDCSPQQDGSFVQKATETIESNRDYNLSSASCCGLYCGRGCDSLIIDSLCRGVGFCGDHSVAVLSVLRTLGVPPYNVYAAFSSYAGGSEGSKFRHAYVIYYCDPEMPPHHLLSACEGNMDKWLRVDATHHTIEPYEGTPWCRHLCIAYNDYGAFPQIDASARGFGGAYNSTAGYAFPKSGMGGLASQGNLNQGRELNCNTDSTDSYCFLNRESPPGICQYIGIENCLT
jgi:hypothetical protein